jgi:predicted alpha/beta-hydrolase family hydrolase
MGEPKIFTEGSTSGFLHTAAGPPRDGLVLTHGAGGNCQAPLLIAVAEAFASAGFHVLRCDLPFRRQRRFGPPFPAQAAADRNGLKLATAEMGKLVPGRIFLGGHSYGGRQASLLASEDSGAADGLLLLSYPLHPPKKPENLRTAHFPTLRTPCLFVHGTKDPFGSVQELQNAIEAIPGPTELSVIERTGHDLLRGNFDVLKLVLEPFRSLAAIT